MPRKIRQLVSDLTEAGFVRVEGGNDAHHYQEKQVFNAIREASK